jgi:hypothetical protein
MYIHIHPGDGGPWLHQGLQVAVLRRRAAGGVEPGARAGEPVPQRGRRGGPRRPGLGPVDHGQLGMAGGGGQGGGHAGERRRRRRAARRVRARQGWDAGWLARGRGWVRVALAVRRVGRLLRVRGGAVGGRPSRGN